MTYIDDLLMTLSFLSFLKVIDYIGHRNHVKYKIRVMQLFIYIYICLQIKIFHYLKLIHFRY